MRLSLSICNIKHINYALQKKLEDTIFAPKPLPCKIIRSKEGTIESMWLYLENVLYTFQNTKLLGEGLTSSVYMMEDVEHRVAFAVRDSKDMSDFQLTGLLMETNCEVLKSRYVSYGDEEYWTLHPELEKQHVFIMELAEGTLLELLQEKKAHMSAATALVVVENLRQQMVCLYELDPIRHLFVYCDVKPQNILYKCDSFGNLSRIRVFLGDLASAVPAEVDRNTRNYVYDYTYSPREGTGIHESIFSTPAGEVRKKQLLSWNVGVALLFMTSFFMPEANDTGIMLFQYVRNEELQRDLQRKNKVIPHSKIQNYLTSCYREVHSQSMGNYLQDTPELRPDIMFPLTTKSTFIEAYLKYETDKDYNKLYRELLDLYQNAIRVYSSALGIGSNTDSPYLDLNQVTAVKTSYELLSNSLLRCIDMKDILISHPSMAYNTSYIIEIKNKLDEYVKTIISIQVALELKPSNPNLVDVELVKADPMFTNVQFTCDLSTTKLALQLLQVETFNTDVTEEFVQPGVHESKKLLLDLLLQIVDNNIPSYLRKLLCFSVYMTPSVFVTYTDLKLAQEPDDLGNPFTNALLLYQSWESHTRQIRELTTLRNNLLSPESIQSAVAEIDQFQTKNSGISNIRFLLNLRALLQSLEAETLRIVTAVAEDDSSIDDLEERVKGLKLYLNQMRNAVYYCTVVINTCSYLQNLYAEYENRQLGVDFSVYLTSLDKNIDFSNFVDTCIDLDRYVILYRYCFYMDLKVPYSVNSWEKFTIQVQQTIDDNSMFDADGNNVLTLVRLNFRVNMYKRQVYWNQYQKKQPEMLTAFEKVKTLAKSYSNIEFDFTSVLWELKQQVASL